MVIYEMKLWCYILFCITSEIIEITTCSILNSLLILKYVTADL